MYVVCDSTQAPTDRSPEDLSWGSKSHAWRSRQDEAASALELLRRAGATEGELRLLRSYGDVLTVLGRTHEAAESLVPGS